MERLNSISDNFWLRGQMWYHFWFDSVNAGSVLNKSISDTLSVTDSLTKLPGNRITESISTTDSIDREYFITKSDTLLTSDQKSQLISKIQSDNLYILDYYNVLLIRNLVKELSDSLSIVDNKTTLFDKVSPEHVNLSDSVNKQVYKLCTDTLGALDNLLKENKKNISLSEVLNISDTVSRQGMFSRTLTDNITTNDIASSLYLDRILKIVNTINPFLSISTISYKNLNISSSMQKSDTITPEEVRELNIKSSSRKNLKILSRHGL